MKNNLLAFVLDLHGRTRRSLQPRRFHPLGENLGGDLGWVWYFDPRPELFEINSKSIFHPQILSHLMIRKILLYSPLLI